MGEWNDVAQARLEKALREPKRGASSKAIAPAPKPGPLPLPAPGSPSSSSSASSSSSDGSGSHSTPSCGERQAGDKAVSDSAIFDHPLYVQLMDEYEDRRQELEKMQKLLEDKENETSALICRCQRYEEELADRSAPLHKKRRTE